MGSIFVFVDNGKRQINDFVRRPVVVADGIDMGVGEGRVEGANKGDITAPESVNALSIVTYRSQAIRVPREFLDDGCLHHVDVLVLVHKDIRVLSAHILLHPRDIQRLVKVEQQVIKIHLDQILFPFFVFLHHTQNRFGACILRSLAVFPGTFHWIFSEVFGEILPGISAKAVF